VDTARTEFAWRVHTAQEAWTARTDIKASVLLAFEAALLVAVVTSHGEVGVRGAPGEWVHSGRYLGTGLLLLAVGLAAAAVFPVMGRRRGQDTSGAANLVYFGYLRNVSQPDLVRRLSELRAEEELAALALQIGALSRMNWRKYRLLQLSFLAMFVALVALGPTVIYLVGHGG
jgi:Family of unknown function (DUF5706)